jgi:hypothetical protein
MVGGREVETAGLSFEGRAGSSPVGLEPRRDALGALAD